jgi:hypothetical protein
VECFGKIFATFEAEEIVESVIEYIFISSKQLIVHLLSVSKVIEILESAA